MAQVYLSYAAEDARTAQDVATHLGRAGAQAFRDDERVHAGAHLTDEVKAAIARSVCFVALYSKASSESQWVRQELEYALERGLPIVPVRLDDQSYAPWWKERIGEMGQVDASQGGEAWIERLLAGVTRFSSEGCPVISIMNLKGGVGKTTIAAHVFSTLQALKKNRVLLVDMDPQYNLSQMFFQRTTVDTLGLMDCSVISLFEPSQLQNFPSPGEKWETVETADAPTAQPDQISRRLIPDARGRGRLDVIVGQFEIAKYAFTDDPVHLGRARVRFKRSIEALRRHYDLIVIDTNPSASFLTRCAIDVSTLLIAPVRPDRLSLRGVRLLRKLFAKLLDEPAWPPVHLLINGVDRGAMSEFEDDLRAGRLDAEVKFQASRFTLKHRLYDSQYLAVRPEGDASEPLKHLAYYRASGIWGGEVKKTLAGIANEIAELADARDARKLEEA